jgi:hypothetical protein
MSEEERSSFPKVFLCPKIEAVMAKTVDYKGGSPSELWVIEVDNTFRTYVYEGQAILRLHKLLQQGKQARLVRYVKERKNEDE